MILLEGNRRFKEVFMLVLVLAADMNLGIGKDNKLPWSFAKDMQFFKNLTHGHTVLLGSYTWDSILEANSRLPGRDKIILSTKIAPNEKKLATGLETYTNSRNLAIAATQDSDEVVFVIGGASIYKEFASAAAYAVVTRVHAQFDCDKFIDRTIEMRFSDPLLNHDVVDTDRQTQNPVKLSFTLYGNTNRAIGEPIPSALLDAYSRCINSVKGWFDQTS